MRIVNHDGAKGGKWCFRAVVMNPPLQSDRERGFTLVEVLLGVTVTSGLLAGAYLCLDAGFQSQKTVETRMDLMQNARVALAFMTADLRSACKLHDDFEFLGLDRILGEREADNLDFATRNWRPQAPGEGDYCEVSYYVDTHPESGVPGLWRRRDPSPDAEPLEGGSREMIASGLHSLRLEYYDGFDWYDTWGTLSQSRREAAGYGSGFNLYGMPDAVRITLALSSQRQPRQSSSRSRPEPERPDDDALAFQTVVYLNMAGRISSSSSQTGTGGGQSGQATGGGGN